MLVCIVYWWEPAVHSGLWGFSFHRDDTNDRLFVIFLFWSCNAAWLCVGCQRFDGPLHHVGKTVDSFSINILFFLCSGTWFTCGKQSACFFPLFSLTTTLQFFSFEFGYYDAAKKYYSESPSHSSLGGGDGGGMFAGGTFIDDCLSMFVMWHDILWWSHPAAGRRPWLLLIRRCVVYLMTGCQC